MDSKSDQKNVRSGQETVNLWEMGRLGSRGLDRNSSEIPHWCALDCRFKDNVTPVRTLDLGLFGTASGRKAVPNGRLSVAVFRKAGSLFQRAEARSWPVVASHSFGRLVLGLCHWSWDEIVVIWGPFSNFSIREKKKWKRKEKKKVGPPVIELRGAQLGDFSPSLVAAVQTIGVAMALCAPAVGSDGAASSSSSSKADPPSSSCPTPVHRALQFRPSSPDLVFGSRPCGLLRRHGWSWRHRRWGSGFPSLRTSVCHLAPSHLRLLWVHLRSSSSWLGPGGSVLDLGEKASDQWWLFAPWVHSAGASCSGSCAAFSVPQLHKLVCPGLWIDIVSPTISSVLRGIAGRLVFWVSAFSVPCLVSTRWLGVPSTSWVCCFLFFLHYFAKCAVLVELLLYYYLALGDFA